MGAVTDDAPFGRGVVTTYAIIPGSFPFFLLPAGFDGAYGYPRHFCSRKIAKVIVTAASESPGAGHPVISPAARITFHKCGIITNATAIQCISRKVLAAPLEQVSDSREYRELGHDRCLHSLREAPNAFLLTNLTDRI